MEGPPALPEAGHPQGVRRIRKAAKLPTATQAIGSLDRSESFSSSKNHRHIKTSLPAAVQGDKS